MHKATLSLFNAIQVDNKKKAKDILLKKTIKHGFILSPEVANIADEKLLKLIADMIGISGEKANASFHKSWKIIEKSSDEELVIQQIIHYITTYGFERLGIYSEDSIYIPHEVLKLPKIKESIRLVVIKGLTADEILEKILQLSMGIALKTETLESILKIVETNKYDSSMIDDVKNRELKSKLYDFYGIVPNDPLEFLRYVINKLTNESLLIKNDKLIAKIKESNSTLHVKTLDRLIEQAPKTLPEIFLRYKPLFLALKTISKNKTFFNQLRKKADKMHKPMKEDYLNSVTSRLASSKRTSVSTLKEELAKVNIFRKIRLAYALKFRTNDNESIVYRVRNGKGYATNFNFKNKTAAANALKVVIDSIVKDLKVKGKTIYIPSNINYALPATEKMFTGHFPTGTYVTVPKEMIVGIHWFDTIKKGSDYDNGRVDLDLSTISASGKTGWDSNYRTENSNVLFSGDVTAAPRPKGASEFFYIKHGSKDDKIMYVNYFNFREDDPVEAKIIVAQDSPSNFKSNYIIDVNKIIAVALISITRKENVLGIITKVENENRFYFANTSIGNNITSSSNEASKHARKYFVSNFTDTIDFKEILKKAGAKIIDKKPTTKTEFTDLSPEALDKTTIINLLTQ